MKFPAFMRDAVNVYRTKQYIVKQNISMGYNERDGKTVISHDTFYKRTPARDQQYDMFFSGLRNHNGKRIPTFAYTRRYVD